MDGLRRCWLFAKVAEPAALAVEQTPETVEQVAAIEPAVAAAAQVVPADSHDAQPAETERGEAAGTEFAGKFAGTGYSLGTGYQR